MSTILKALRRLEEDRNANPSRPLREAVASGADEPGTRRRGGWLLGALLGISVGLGASGAAYWMASQPTEVPPVAVAPRPEPRERAAPPAEPATATAAEPATATAAGRVAERAAPPPTVVTVSEPSLDDLSDEALRSAVEMVRRPPPEPRIDASNAGEPVELGTPPEPRVATSTSSLGTHKPGLSPTAATAAARRAAARERAEDLMLRGASAESVAAVSSSRPATTPKSAGDPWERAIAADVAGEPARAPEPKVATAPKPAPKPKVAAAPKPAPEPKVAAAPKPAPEPKVAAAPKPAPEPKASPPPKPRPEVVSRAAVAVPGVRVEKTSWHPSAERRTALIEVDGGLEEIQEGDAVGPLVVSTIEPSGVVFDHGGKQIRRRVGE